MRYTVANAAGGQSAGLPGEESYEQVCIELRPSEVPGRRRLHPIVSIMGPPGEALVLLTGF